MKLSLYKSDTIGAFASSLCVIHCLATPLLFIAQTGAVYKSNEALFWWGNLDYLFLGISFLAIYRSTQTTSLKSMKYALWTSWTLLLVLILNEKMHWIHLSEIITYIVALTLAGLHIYNLKYCQCDNEKCCTKNG